VGAVARTSMERGDQVRGCEDLPAMTSTLLDWVLPWLFGGDRDDRGVGP
jgi:hypothetical protein